MLVGIKGVVDDCPSVCTNSGGSPSALLVRFAFFPSAVESCGGYLQQLCSSMGCAGLVNYSWLGWEFYPSLFVKGVEGSRWLVWEKAELEGCHRTIT